MGTWGYKPFQNDAALNYYGGFHRLAEMKQLIKDGLAGKHRNCCAPYEIAGVVLESFGLYDLGHKDKFKVVLSSIKSRNYSSDVKDTLYESLEMFISVSALSVNSRKNVLQECIKGIKQYKDFNPYEYEQEVNNVVNIAQKALASDLKSAVTISEQDLDWIIDSYENAEKQEKIDCTRKMYPNGLAIIRIYDRGEGRIYTIGICPGGTRIIPDIDLDNYKDKGINLDDINFKIVNNIDEFMTKYFSNGFKIVKHSEKESENGYKFYTVYSNDYHKNMFRDSLYYDDTQKDKFYIPLEYEDKPLINLFKKYAAASSTKTINQTTGNRAIDKFYDKNGKIIGYRITDGKKVMDVYSDQLKQAIASGKIKFDNLTLTKDGRLYMTGTN